MLEDPERWPRLLVATWAVGLMALGTGCGDEVPGCVDPPPVTNESFFIQLSPEDSFANVSIDGEAMGTFYLDGTVRLDPCDTSDCAFTVTDLDLYSWAGPDGPGHESMSVCISSPLSLASTQGSILFPGTVEARLELGGTPSRAINPPPGTAVFPPEDDVFGLSVTLRDTLGREVHIVISGSIMP